MKRTIAVVAVLVASAALAVLAYQTMARQRDYRVLVARGDAALRDDQTFAAIEAYSGAIFLRPDSMLAFLRRGETYRRRGDRGDLEAAARDFRAAAALDPSAPRPLEELGDVLYRLERYPRSVEAYEQSAALDDRSARVTYKLALARYRNGDTDAALAALKQSVHLNPDLADAYYLLGVCLREKQRTAEAIEALEKAVSLSPALVPAREELADIFGRVGRRADELEQLQLLAGLDRDRTARQVAVGLAHARARHWDSAVLTLSSALERTPDDPVLYRALGQVWLESAQARSDRVDLSKAREALERIASGPGATSEVLTLSGRAALQDGDLDVAERTLREATTRFPVDPSAFLWYAAAAERLNHLDAARRALVQHGALVAAPPPAEAAADASRIAALSARLNDWVGAAEWYGKAQTATPNDLRLAASLADAQLRSGDRAAAAATIARGLEKDANNAPLLSLARRTR
ncbi:MAG: tetratricopeptide repeat protein [Vicinamibacterales bacterium]